MTLNWRYIYPFSTAGAYFIRRRTLWMSYGLFTFVSSLLFFCEKWTFFFFVGMLLNGVQNRLHKTVLFKVGSFYSLFS